MRDYTILRNMSLSRTAEPFGRSPRALGVPTTAAIPEPKIEVERLTGNDVQDIVRDPEVEAIAPIMPTALIRPFEVDASAAVTEAWGLQAVKADASPFNGSNVVVAVLDTGCDKSHSAFQGVTLVEEDFSGSGNGDRQGHGTHCAGTIFGRDVDGTRIGVARGVSRALIGKVLTDTGSGDSDMIFKGILWAVQQRADVISMSLGFDFPGLVERLVKAGWPVDLATSAALEGYRGNLRMFDVLMDMVRAQAAFGGTAVVVAAAGNESRRNENPDHEIAVSIPAAAEGVVSVGALEKQENQLNVAFFSNTFPQVSAPGAGVLSAKAGGGLRALSGTSMACPHVAGVAALWWESLRASPINANAAAVVAKVLATARTDGFAPGVDPSDRGMGIVTAPL